MAEKQNNGSSVIDCRLTSTTALKFLREALSLCCSCSEGHTPAPSSAQAFSPSKKGGPSQGWPGTCWLSYISDGKIITVQSVLSVLCSGDCWIFFLGGKPCFSLCMWLSRSLSKMKWSISWSFHFKRSTCVCPSFAHEGNYRERRRKEQNKTWANKE